MHIVHFASRTNLGDGIDPARARLAAEQNGQTPTKCPHCSAVAARFHWQTQLWVTKRGRHGIGRLVDNDVRLPGQTVQCSNPQCRKWITLPTPTHLQTANR